MKITYVLLFILFANFLFYFVFVLQIIIVFIFVQFELCRFLRSGAVSLNAIYAVPICWSRDFGF